MKIIDGDLMGIISQALNQWSTQLDKDVSELTQAADRGENVPKNVIGLFRENAERIKKAFEKWEELSEQNIVALNNDEFDELTTYNYLSLD